MSQQKPPNYRLKRLDPGVYRIAGAQHEAYIIAHLSGFRMEYTVDIIDSKQPEAVTEPQVFTATLSDAAAYARDTLQQLDG